MTLRCELSKPAASVEWKRGAELLKNVDKCQIRKKDLLVELKIIDANLEDSGVYTCICGEQKTTATVTINGGYILVILWKCWRKLEYCIWQIGCIFHQ